LKECEKYKFNKDIFKDLNQVSSVLSNHTDVAKTPFDNFIERY
jgi:hypothetical protein